MVTWLQDRDLFVEKHGGAKLLSSQQQEAEQENSGREEEARKHVNYPKQHLHFPTHTHSKVCSPNPLGGPQSIKLTLYPNFHRYHKGTVHHYAIRPKT